MKQETRGVSMRVVGLFSRNPLALKSFAERSQRVASNWTGVAARLRLWPAGAPLLAIAAAEECSPPLQWAEHPDGSFALLDGEAFGINGSGFGQSKGREAAALLSLYVAKGPEALAELVLENRTGG
jgi:hypothetical protein